MFEIVFFSRSVDAPPPPRDGSKWSRSQSMGANWQGGGRGGRQAPPNRSHDSSELSGGANGRGRGLRTTVSWHEDRTAVLQGNPLPDRSLSRRNSRSEGPGRWDHHKDEASGSLDRRPSQGPERWPSYGHRDPKDKPPRGAREDPEDLEGLFPPPASHKQYNNDQDPPWMHHRESKSTERAEQHRKSAAEFEQKRKQMRETLAKEKKGGGGGGLSGDNSMLMTDEEINKFKKEIEAENQGKNTSGVYTFDSFKAALKSQGVSNLPPMPTAGINTVDQIEKTMKPSIGGGISPHPAAAEADKQKLDLFKMLNNQDPANSNQTGGNLEGTNLLLSMLKGQNQAPQKTGFPQINIQQQQQSSGSALERFFASKPHPGGIPGFSNVPFKQQSMNQGQLNASLNNTSQQNPLLTALMANQAQQNAQRSANQAQMLAHLKQAQQQSTKPQSNPQTLEQSFAMKFSGPGKVKEGENSANGTGKLNQSPLEALGLTKQGPAIGNRPQIPGMPFMGPPARPGLFQGGFGGQPGLFMQNGGGFNRPSTGPITGMNPLVFNAPSTGSQAPFSLANMLQNRQGLNFQNSVLSSQQQQPQNPSNGLNRFFSGGAGIPGFGQNSTGDLRAPKVDSTAQRQSLEEVKNEAQ